jgi:hypothetical protein
MLHLGLDDVAKRGKVRQDRAALHDILRQEWLRAARRGPPFYLLLQISGKLHVSLGGREVRWSAAMELEECAMKCTILKRRIGEGRHRVRFASVGTAADFGGKRPPWLWSFEGDDGILEIVSGTRPTEGSVCGQLFWLLTSAEPGQDGDTDVAVGQIVAADVSFDDDGRRVVRLRHEESGREVTITNNVE